MTGLLLDTSAYSALGRGNAGVLASLQRAERIHVSPVVIGELLAGFKKGTTEARNRRAFDQFLSSASIHVLHVDAETAERYALALDGLRRQGKPIPSNDLWIAASALQHGLPVLTTDAHFRRVPGLLVEFIEAS